MSLACITVVRDETTQVTIRDATTVEITVIRTC